MNSPTPLLPAQLLGHIQELTHNGTIVVLPTDITTRYWQKKLIASAVEPPPDTDTVSSASMWNHSIVAWDVFKQNYLFSHQSLQPIGHIQRIIFAYSLAYLQLKQRLFTTIMQERNPIGSSSIERVVFLLPFLHKLVADSTYATISKRDAQLVYTHYTQYMNTLKVYEPFWTQPSLQHIDRAKILFVDLIHDINYFQSAMQPHVQQSIAPISTSHMFDIPPHCTTTLFQNSLDEITDRALTIHNLIHDGVNPHDIHVSVGNIQLLAPTISVIFSRYTIPHTLHTSVKVADTLFGEIIRSMVVISMYDASYTDVRELVENQNIPLKDRNQLGQLLSKARRNHRLYHVFVGGLSKSLTAIAKARSFTELQTGLTIFFERFVDDAQWLTQELHEISFGMSILGTLVNIELVQEASYKDALKIFLEILCDTVYRSPRINSGVNVYGIPMAAGIYPDYHFIINVSSKTLESLNATNRLARQYNIDTSSFVCEQSIYQLLQVYATSGKRVHFSCSYQHAATAILPYPPLFAGAPTTSAPVVVATHQQIFDIVHPILPATSKATEIYRRCDIISDSAIWFNDTQLTPKQIAQLNNSYLVQNNPTHADAHTDDALTFDAHAAAVDATMYISMRHLRAFKQCKYGLLFELMSRPHHIQHDIDINNYTGIGSVIHEVLSLILNAQQSTVFGKNFNPPSIEEINEHVVNAAHLASYQESMLHDAIVQQITSAIDILIERFNGWRIVQTDMSVRKDIPSTSCVFTGIIDLLLQSSNSSIYAIVDFKRSGKSIAYYQDKYDQLLYYAALAQHQGIDCRYAWYILLAEQKLLPASNKKSDELFAPNSSAIQEICTSMEACAHTIANGNYQTQADGSICEHCTTVAQCRRYHQHHRR